VDKYALKPVARGYRAVVPEQVQIMLGNALNNVTWVPRFINSLLQGKWEGALREVSRFVLNSPRDRRAVRPGQGRPSSNRARKTSVRRSASGASRLVRISSGRCSDRRPFATASARVWTAR